MIGEPADHRPDALRRVHRIDRRPEPPSPISITARLPEDALYQELHARQSEWADHGIVRVDAIGDAHAPGLIVHAVYAGHRYAREFDDTRSHEERVDSVPFRRQRVVL